jgi:hypothetical protein
MYRAITHRSFASSLRRCVLALGPLLALFAGDAVASQQDIPPPPPENFVRMTESEVLAQLPERERGMVEREQSARDKFEALLDVSELRLADLEHRVTEGARPYVPTLLLYEAVVLAANDRLRSPEAGVKPRDKRYKEFERRLNRQLGILKAVVAALPYTDASTGEAVVGTVTKVRAAALDSALDVNILSEP